MDISPNPPQILEHHVRVPDQVAHLLGAGQLHARGVKGEGIRIAVIDSGFFPHPFYTERAYRITHIPTRKESKPHVDEYGHGTAQLASLFSLAPKAEALVIKCMERDPSYALEKAIELKPHIISCAWGFNIDHPDTRDIPPGYRRLRTLVRRAVDEGITVVAAGGNGQHAFPASMPQVIAAGGVFFGPDAKFYESDVSSKFESSFYPGRHVPDVCGIVGNRPYGRLLLVPVPPKAKLARRTAFATIAAGDSSDVQKGWAMFSGTSAATSMIAGACALLLERYPSLTPAQIKKVLIDGSEAVEDSRLLNVAASMRLASSLR